MEYDLEDKQVERIKSIKEQGHSFFGLDAKVLEENEFNDTLSKVYGEEHLDELNEDIERLLEEEKASAEVVYSACQHRIEREGYVIAPDIEQFAQMAE